jgi:hypothetical protein
VFLIKTPAYWHCHTEAHVSHHSNHKLSPKDDMAEKLIVEKLQGIWNAKGGGGDEGEKGGYVDWKAEGKRRYEALMVVLGA